MFLLKCFSNFTKASFDVLQSDNRYIISLLSLRYTSGTIFSFIRTCSCGFFHRKLCYYTEKNWCVYITYSVCIQWDVWIICRYRWNHIHRLWLAIGITEQKRAKLREMCVLWSLTYFVCGECVPCSACVADPFSFRIGTIFSLPLYGDTELLK